jgi:reactive intermediate/imine deaminase
MLNVIERRSHPMNKEIVSTRRAPAAIGPYSQAVKTGLVVFTSGQIGLDPETAELVSGDFEAQVRQAFRNLAAVAQAAGGSLANAVKFTLFLTDLSQFNIANNIMAEVVPQPFPARSTVGVASLPKGAQFEVEAVLVL